MFGLSKTERRSRAAASAILLTFALAANSAEARWYVGHMSGETCVPVDDISEDLKRLYYGSGPMHTPEDLIKLYSDHGGVKLTLVPDTVTGTRMYKNEAAGIMFVFFEDPDICRALMATLGR